MVTMTRVTGNVTMMTIDAVVLEVILTDMRMVTSQMVSIADKHVYRFNRNHLMRVVRDSLRADNVVFHAVTRASHLRKGAVDNIRFFLVRFWQNNVGCLVIFRNGVL